MSLGAGSVRHRPFIIQLLAAALALAGAGYWLQVAGPSIPAQGPGAVNAVAAPEREQAPWKVRAFPSGLTSSLTRKQLGPVKAAKPRLSRIVATIHDAALLRPQQIEPVLRRWFSVRARRAFVDGYPGLPHGVSEVVTRVRRSRIGIAAPNARRAAASTVILVTGRAEQRRFKARYRSTLWLERSGGGWKVIAFDLARRPVQ